MAIQNLGHGNNPLSAKEASSYHRPPTSTEITMRSNTNQLLEQIDEGLLDPMYVLGFCLKFMSDDQVGEMMDDNEIPREEA